MKTVGPDFGFLSKDLAAFSIFITAPGGSLSQRIIFCILLQRDRRRPVSSGALTCLKVVRGHVFGG